MKGRSSPSHRPRGPPEPPPVVPALARSVAPQELLHQGAGSSICSPWACKGSGVTGTWGAPVPPRGNFGGEQTSLCLF